MKLETETVAYWYFRLNGFFQIKNFVVHPHSGRGGQRTDADLIGVRFPFRAERVMDNPDDQMQDDHQGLDLGAGGTEIVIVEVKKNDPCTLNGPWTDKDAQNVQRVLAAIGSFEVDRLEEIAESIYGTGQFEEGGVRVRLVAVGRSIDEELKKRFPSVVQLTWPQILCFIGERLNRYRSIKADVSQWDDQIRGMQQMVTDHRSGQAFDLNGFVAECLGNLGIK